MKKISVLLCMLVLLTGSAFAMGQGTTKIDFKFTVGDAASSRLFIKRDIRATIGLLPEVGTPTKNDNLANSTVNLTIGDSTVISGLANEKGKVTTPFAAKITGNGKGFQLKASNGAVDLEKVLLPFGLDVAKEGKDQSIVVPLKISVTLPAVVNPDPAAPPAEPVEVVLSQDDVTFKYSVKKGKVKGRNF